jgi:hypothetical protein
MFNACANCESTIVFGGREYGGRRYCSQECEGWARHPGFCAACLQATTDKSAWNWLSFRGARIRLAFRRDPCPTCGSYLQTQVFALLFVPIIPLGRYRVRWVTPKRSVSRRLRKGPARTSM